MTYSWRSTGLNRRRSSMCFGHVRSLAWWSLTGCASRPRRCAVVHSVPHLRTFATYSRRRLASRLKVSIPVTFEAARWPVSTLIYSGVRHFAAKIHHPLPQQHLRLMVIGEEHYHRPIRLVRGLAQPSHSLDLHPVLLCDGFHCLLGDVVAELGTDCRPIDAIYFDGYHCSPSTRASRNRGSWSHWSCCGACRTASSVANVILTWSSPPTRRCSPVQRTSFVASCLLNASLILSWSCAKTVGEVAGPTKVQDDG